MTESTLTTASEAPAKAALSAAEAEREDARRLGRALGVLRQRAGLTRAEAAANMGLGDEGWARYERGELSGIFRPGVQERLTAALGQSAADLVDELARVVAADGARDYPGLPDARP